ncbi:hypothetical protein Rs2_08097 [Raphanus sativus]|uniref:Formin-like protein 20 n=1 Tax=Raphanus sativus TaxID=3726 RepID=A0A6J0MJC6_RAPSA|nr:formin-like protein 20 [Raphanus sativus]XP_018471592.1 formin-like protein 20 [Raphanus sativus]KAJ4913476.1 hypothetical protein Rs2_08097 [Raphanus sativus]
MASDRVNSGSKGFDFGSDDILCSYDDFTNQDHPSNGSNSDPAIAANKEFHKTRMARSSVFPTSSSYTPPEDSSSHDVNATVERTMKKYSENMMRFLEGISSRLSQLELYCYNLDKTIGEMRSDLTRDNEEADVKLRSMDKHLQEVNRSVQVLRDKQELADTQKELARLQLVQKDSSSSSHGEERVATPVPEAKKCDNASDAQNNQLALALPHQIAPQPPVQPQPRPQHQQYYMPPTTQLQNTPPPAPPSQPQAPPGQAQFMPPPPAPSHPSSAQTQSFPQYQQNWPPQPQARLQSSGAYTTYSHAPPSNQSPVEQLPSSMQMQSPYAGPPQQSMQTYGYGAPPPQAPQQTKMSYNPQTGDGYLPAGPPPPPGYTNAMYESGRMQYPPPAQQHQQQQVHYMQGPQGGGYAPQQHQADGGNTGTPPPVLRSKYGELIEKLVSMGFRGDHVMAVIQRMEESGQAIDFNALLDRLNVQSSSGGPPRGW